MVLSDGGATGGPALGSIADPGTGALIQGRFAISSHQGQPVVLEQISAATRPSFLDDRRKDVEAAYKSPLKACKAVVNESYKLWLQVTPPPLDPPRESLVHTMLITMLIRMRSMRPPTW